MQSCAVIGASGFIGGHLVRELADQGRAVLGLGRSLPAQPDPRARYAQVDMQDQAGLARALAGVDTVFHLGATIPNAFVHAPEVVREGNRRGAEAVVAACRAAKVARLVYVTGHLAPPPGGAPADLAFLEGKVAAEELILGAHGPGLATCSLRAPVIFGPGDKITTAFLRGKAPAFPGFGRTFGFMYVDELVRLVARAGERLGAGSPRVAGQALDAPGERMTFEAFFSLPAWQRRPPRFLPYRGVRVLAALNAWCARALGAAPLGAEMCPQVLDSMALHHRKEGGLDAAQALELDAPPRPVEDGLRAYLARLG